MITTSPRPPARPVRDEWGVYDPQQAGLAALFARLDLRDAVARETAETEEPSTPQSTTPPRPSLRDAT